MHPRRTMKKSSTMEMSFQKIQNYGGLADPQNFLSMKISSRKANDSVHFTF